MKFEGCPYCGHLNEIFAAIVQDFQTVSEQFEMMECDPPAGEEGGAKRRSAQKLIER